MAWCKRHSNTCQNGSYCSHLHSTLLPCCRILFACCRLTTSYKYFKNGWLLFDFWSIPMIHVACHRCVWSTNTFNTKGHFSILTGCHQQSRIIPPKMVLSTPSMNFWKLVISELCMCFSNIKHTKLYIPASNNFISFPILVANNVNNHAYSIFLMTLSSNLWKHWSYCISYGERFFLNGILIQ